MKTISIVIILLMIVGCCSAKAEQTFSVKVRYPDLEPNDTLWLQVKETFFSLRSDLPGQIHSATVDAEGFYSFLIPVSTYRGRFSLQQKIVTEQGKERVIRLILSDYYWESGDNLTLSIRGSQKIPVSRRSTHYDFYYSFQGTGALKNSVRSKVDSIYYHTPLLGEYVQNCFDEAHHYQDARQLQVQKSLHYLASQKERLPAYYHDLLACDIVFRLMPERFRNVKRYYDTHIKQNDQVRQHFVLQNSDNLIPDASVQVPDSILADCMPYIEYLSHKEQFRSYMLTGEDNTAATLEALANQYSGRISERSMIYSLLVRAPEGFQTMAASIVAKLSDEESIRALNFLRARFDSDTIYTFTLSDQDNIPFSLSKLQGQWAFIDIWFTGCGGCRQYYQKVLEPVAKSWNDPRLRFVSVSIDKNYERWLTSVESEKYTGSHAENLYTNGQGEDHPLIRHYNVGSYPTLILLDPAGKVRKFNTSELHVLDKENLKSILKAQVEIGF